MGTGDMRQEVAAMLERQLSGWELAGSNYAALNGVQTRELRIGDARFKVQHNLARVTSTAAKVDPATIKARPCFLCKENRPPQQEGLLWGSGYEILVNPYPIFPRHLTIVSRTHEPQSIVSRIADMMLLAADLADFVVFYNGPRCGASAPDHQHFQAGNKGFIPLDCDLAEHGEWQTVASGGGARLNLVANLGRVAFVLDAVSVDAGTAMFERLYNAMPADGSGEEPMLNILCWIEEGARWRIVVFPRAKHRPSCYYATVEEERMLISPASVDLGGVVIVPLQKDFDRLTAASLGQILDEVCIGEEVAKSIAERMKQNN